MSCIAQPLNSLDSPFENDVPAIGCRNFYGRRKRRSDEFIAVLPPDPNISDVGSSEDDNEVDFGEAVLSPPSSPQLLPVHDDNWSSDDEIPLSNYVTAPTTGDTKKNTNKKKIHTYTWKKEDFQHNQIPNEKIFDVPFDVLTPLQYFKKFWDDSVFEYISNETNTYSTLVTGTCINTSPTEIKQFIALELIMGVVSMPSLDDYWAVNTRYSLVADVMPVKRFKKLRRLIHFQDNNAEPNGDRFFKIRPLLEKIRENCNKTEDEELYSIDEMMILYKGTKAGNLRQYMPKKPKKWGFKMFVRAGVSGIVYDFLMYAGSTTFNNVTFSEQEEGLGSSGKVVAHLCKTIPHPETSIVYFDNWFCSLELITLLKNSYNINSLGTIRSNRLRNCTLENDKSLLQKGRGSYDYMNDNNIGIAVVRWADTKCVTLASSFVSYSPVVSVKRYSKEEKKKLMLIALRL
nr:unnamed protein product [Callosobruchus chinensis]